MTADCAPARDAAVGISSAKQSAIIMPAVVAFTAAMANFVRPVEKKSPKRTAAMGSPRDDRMHHFIASHLLSVAAKMGAATAMPSGML